MKIDVNLSTIKFIVDSLIDLLRYAGWQILLFLIFIEYKRDIRSVFQFISRRVSGVSLNNVSIEFAKSVDEMQKEKINDDIQTDDKDFGELVSVRPEYAVLDSWKEVENELRTLFPSSLRPLEYNEDIRRREILDEKDIGLLNHLRFLKNEVLNNRKIIVSKETAQKYREQCLYIIKKLKTESDKLS
ncbi:hypothetical protein [Limosilactobacillus reuteri]|uniref:hypothetical protein n=1 Tax=Limosilactobacillus reuteri TaxID=1598 RepID=UPI001E2B3610|nr:hypothetical protein [Limosilactobacillus reuteri]MCC4518432.1 hypothetical protein [Limosilactobacillus reuteri]